jgi:hypothetical protein
MEMTWSIFAVSYSAPGYYGQSVLVLFLDKKEAALAFFGKFAVFFHFSEESRIGQDFNK